MLPKTAFSSSLLFYTLSLASSLYDEKLVKSLTSNNFASLVESSLKPALVEFYSPGCPHCVNLVPIWRNVASNLAGHIQTFGVNCQQDTLCNKYSIRGVPAIKIFLKDEKGKTYWLDYEGDRKADAIIKWARGYATSFVVKVSESKSGGNIINLQKFLKQDSELPHIVFFKRESMVPSLGLNTLSVDYKGKYVFGIVNRKIDGARIANLLGVKLPDGSDALVVIGPNEEKGELYSGPLLFTPMKAHLDKIHAEFKQHKSEL